MDYIRQLGPVVLDHRFRRMTESLLKAAEEIYEARGLPFRGRWASTYQMLHSDGPLAVGQIAERLRLTHPGVIGITDDMVAAGVVTAVRDSADKRRRLLDLTVQGRKMSAELFLIWTELGDAQRKRFASAGCDIMTVMQRVEDGIVKRPLSSEVLSRITSPGARKPVAGAPTKRATTRRAARSVSSVLFALMIGSAAMGVSREAQAQAPVQAPALDAAARGALVNALADSLVGGYVYESTGRMLADSLRAELRSGAYDRLTTGEALARRVNETLKRISRDGHLGVQYLAPSGSDGPVRRRVPPTTIPERPLPTGATRVISFPDLGIAAAAILPGDIGYLDLSGFSAEEEALKAIDSVMALFAGVKAIVIDVGRNRGGGPIVIQHLSAYFFDKPTHLVSTITREMDAPRERWTADSVPGKRLPKTPVYVLTSGLTISAAESFAFGLRNHGRITIVGEPTAGGGHFGLFVPLTPGFSVFLPRGRTFNPATDQGWEAGGLEPDVKVPYEKALETALELARKGG